MTTGPCNPVNQQYKTVQDIVSIEINKLMLLLDSKCDDREFIVDSIKSEASKYLEVPDETAEEIAQIEDYWSRVAKNEANPDWDNISADETNSPY